MVCFVYHSRVLETTTDTEMMSDPDLYITGLFNGFIFYSFCCTFLLFVFKLKKYISIFGQ